MNGSFLQKLERILPRYAALPLAASVLLNAAVYYGGRVFAAGRHHFDFSTGLDRALPFVPAFMAVYVLAFVFWIAGFVIIGRESPAVCFEVMSGEQLAKLMCLLCFLAVPTVMVRPPVPQSGVFSGLTQLIYRMDAPDNLFPSIHCLESWICFRGALRCRKVGRAYRVFALTAALLVFASTLLVKQHLAVDVAGGVAAAELGLLLSRKTGAGRLYAFITRKWITP